MFSLTFPHRTFSPYSLPLGHFSLHPPPWTLYPSRRTFSSFTASPWDISLTFSHWALFLIGHFPDILPSLHPILWTFSTYTFPSEHFPLYPYILGTFPLSSFIWDISQYILPVLFCLHPISLGYFTWHPVLLLGCRIAEILQNVFIDRINWRLVCQSVCRKWEWPTFFNNQCSLKKKEKNAGTVTRHYLCDLMIGWLLIAQPLVAVVSGKKRHFSLWLDWV